MTAQSSEPVVTLIREGDVREIKNKYGEVSKTRIGRVYEVTLDGEAIGYVERSMLTRERRAQGLRYVLARWQSPGWQYRSSKHGRNLECTSLKAGAEALVRELNWRNQKS
ncbi:hypothetical protein EDF62_3353 [Leucobacter luti]|uniref:HIRAN domain-containing protein n=1 Tax=Leucobacter luti TaxID=340320 RepID=A0A4R6RRW0_9MICO|nr:hypothetical protein [Leucobacter luti]TDP89599.1 hypothetical protein EDF62_3353 [Leucobacter luti]